jgi:hypothetical protein
MICVQQQVSNLQVTFHLPNKQVHCPWLVNQIWHKMWNLFWFGSFICYLDVWGSEFLLSPLKAKTGHDLSLSFPILLSHCCLYLVCIVASWWARKGITTFKFNCTSPLFLATIKCSVEIYKDFPPTFLWSFQLTVSFSALVDLVVCFLLVPRSGNLSVSLQWTASTYPMNDILETDSNTLSHWPDHCHHQLECSCCHEKVCHQGDVMQGVGSKNQCVSDMCIDLFWHFG